MKLAPMERADIAAGKPPTERGRRAFAICFALAMHVMVFWILSYIPQKPFSVPTPPIAVKLVIAQPVPKLLNAPKPETPKPVTPPIEPSPEPLKPEPKPEPEPELELEPEPERPSVTIIVEPNIAPPSPDPVVPSAPESGNQIPERWRLPKGAKIPLGKTQQPSSSQTQSLAKALDCLGFSADCAAQRKSIFAEEQLSNTDLVWMASEAHSGLSDSDLYGLSEAQIRERLGITTAGKNGFAILPGIVIDGPWWDALHGVNKACGYSVGVNESGSRELKKNCKPLKPSSKDRIGFIPKPVE